jgi:hypothetical protein
MKPKQKAKELVMSMFQPPVDSLEYKQGQKHFFNQYSAAKPCALIAVAEILNAIYNEDFDGHLIDENDAASYWQEVKREIEKL